MLEEYLFLKSIYSDLIEWKRKSMREKDKLEYIKYDHYNIWKKIIDKKNKNDKRKKLSEIDVEFQNCFYEGKAYRLINYTKRKKHIYPMRYFRSCTTDIKYLENKYKCGEYVFVTLFFGKNDNAINFERLVDFIKKYKLYEEHNPNYFEKLSIDILKKYSYEYEIVGPTKIDNVINVFIYDAKTKEYRKLNRDMWFRNYY